MNAFFFLVLSLSFCLFVFFGIPYIEKNRLVYVNWQYVWQGLPVAFTAFAYQGTVPTLVEYLDRDKKACKKAIFFGTLIPFFIYVVWQALILGILPQEGTGSILEALQKGECAVLPLQKILPEGAFLILSRIFAFSALFTSLVGVALGLGDFIKDSFSLSRKVSAFLVVFPPLFMTFFTSGLFLAALESAGGLGCAILLGALPILLVGYLRYKKKPLPRGSYRAA